MFLFHISKGQGQGQRSEQSNSNRDRDIATNLQRAKSKGMKGSSTHPRRHDVPSSERAPLPYYQWNEETDTFQPKMKPVPKNAPAFTPGFYDYTNSNFRDVGSPSQCKQDAFVLEILDNKKDGFFLDLAANDWREYSNTLFLEMKHHWNGLCFEPNSQYLEGLLGHRRCKVITSPILDKKNERVTFRQKKHIGGILGYDNKMNESINTYNIRAIDESLVTTTLEEALKYFNAPKVIDYFSLDIEGAEFPAMKNFNFEEYSFRVITIERPSEPLHRLLIKNGYKMAAILSNFGEILYINGKDPKLAHFMDLYAPHRKSDTIWSPIQEPQVTHPYILE